MTYKAQLYPWCIIRPFPNMRTKIVGRFRNRSDADGHLQILKRLTPNASYQIMFDIPPELSDAEDLTPPAPLPYKGMGEKDLGSPLLSLPLPQGEGWGEGGEGLEERSIEE